MKRIFLISAWTTVYGCLSSSTVSASAHDSIDRSPTVYSVIDAPNLVWNSISDRVLKAASSDWICPSKCDLILASNPASNRGSVANARVSTVSSRRLPTLAEAQKYYADKDYTNACEALGVLILTSEKTNATAHYLYGNTLSRLRRPSDAIAEYKQALALQPSVQIKDWCLSAIENCKHAPEDFEQVDGAHQGFIGLLIEKNKVGRVLDKSPALLAGFQAGDVITYVGSIAAAGKTTDEMLALLRGPVGSSVNVTYVRNGKPKTVTLTRAVAVQEVYVPKETYVYRRAKGAERTPQAYEQPPKLADKKFQADAIDRELVKVHRRTQNTDTINNEVLAALQTIPPRIKRELKDFGCVVLICPTVNEAKPDSVHDKPRGYKHGGGQDNVPGMYSPSTKTLYIAERASWQNSPPQINSWVRETVLHELGHAYDFCKHNLSSGPAFTEAYAQDTRGMTNSQRNEFDYFVQEGKAGPEELFAELFALCQTDETQKRKVDSFAKAFPHCHTFMENTLSVNRMLK